MSGGGYTPLFSSIVLSTIWRESNETRLVWITMLALADARGIIEASIPGLADAAKVPLEKCKEALVILQSPDEYSRTKDHDGRRIEEVDGGWRLLNIAKFRDKCRNRADYMRDYRAKTVTIKDDKNKPVTNVTNVTICNQPLPPVTDSDSYSDSDKDINKEEGGGEEPTSSTNEISNYSKYIQRLQNSHSTFRKLRDFQWLPVLKIAADRFDILDVVIVDWEREIANQVKPPNQPIPYLRGFIIKAMKKLMKPSELYEFQNKHGLDRSMFLRKENR